MICTLLIFLFLWRLSYVAWEKQLQRRIFIAERDVGDTLNVISADVEKIIELAEENHVTQKEANEVDFLAKKIKDKIVKAKKYVLENIREIPRK